MSIFYRNRFTHFIVIAAELWWKSLHYPLLEHFKFIQVAWNLTKREGKA